MASMDQPVDLFAGLEAVNSSNQDDFDKFEQRMNHLQKQIDEIKSENANAKIKMKDYAATPTGTKSTPKIATVNNSKRSGGASFVNKSISKKSQLDATESMGTPTPKADLEPI